MGLLVGKKDICRFLGGISWQTARRWARRKGLPLVQENGEPPTLMIEHAEAWQRERVRKGGKTC